MTYYDFDPEALDEYEEAVMFYETRREGLGARFVQAVKEAMAATLQFPEMGTLWPGAPASMAIRRRSITGFPAFSIAYTVLDDRLRVVAVVHANRRPGYWFHRTGASR